MCKLTKDTKISAGLVIIQDNKILLVHPTGAKWQHTYSIPKGGVNKGEDLVEAAIRETEEETGVKIKRKHISNKNAGFIDYKNSKKEIYKRVYYFLAYPIKSILANSFQLQLDEVNWVGFISKDEAKNRIFKRFESFLEFLD